MLSVRDELCCLRNFYILIFCLIFKIFIFLENDDHGHRNDEIRITC